MVNQTPDITISQHLISEMERSLALLAARWRSRKDLPEAPTIVAQYQAILRCMIALGYDTELDADSELPDDLLPEEYLSQFE